MRVRENPPPFTLRLLKNFVNSKRPVSTGFLLFLSVFLGFLADLGDFLRAVCVKPLPRAAAAFSNIARV
jgi:hypothetical protein